MHTSLIGFLAETSIHAGAGSSTGVIDLPIMREAHTNYPCVFGSAMKGALRSQLEKHWSAEKITQVFGSTASETSAWAGSLMMGDARLLLLPVRSLTTHFRLVTCPAILQRLQQDAKRLGYAMNFSIPQIKETEAYTVTGEEKHLYLEEYRYKTLQLENSESLLKTLRQFAPDLYLTEQLTLVSNDQFAHLSTTATQITPHIAIDNISKTVKNGALWYEESLPSETLLYGFVSLEDTRKAGEKISGEVLSDELNHHFKQTPYLQVGGNETVGMGWLNVTFVAKEA
jgi:CRISPR-associated protein Cmr4